MQTIEEILNRSRARDQHSNLPYTGAMLPVEAFELSQAREDAVIVDVRTRAERDYVGRIPGSVEIEWQTYPGGVSNPQFLEQLQQVVPKTSAVLFICRSGARSHAAATAAKGAGYAECFNVLEGFEGDKDSQGHRNSLNGWRFAGLPWVQS